MSDESELGVVLASAPRIQKAFGRNWAAVITIVSLYFARRRSGVVGLIASVGRDCHLERRDMLNDLEQTAHPITVAARCHSDGTIT